MFAVPKAGPTKRHQKLRDLIPFITCRLCHGYLIEPTTINECMHTFCKSCIVFHMISSSRCPLCPDGDKDISSANFRLDPILKTLVFKLVPGLCRSEKQRLCTYNATHNYRPAASVHAGTSAVARRIDSGGERASNHKHKRGGGDGGSTTASNHAPHRSTNGVSKHVEKPPIDGASNVKDGPVNEVDLYFAPDDTISLSLEYHPSSNVYCDPDHRIPSVKYLQCPAAVTVHLLQRFLSSKFSLNFDSGTSDIDIQIILDDEVLPSRLSLMDLAYCSKYNRRKPLQVFYQILINSPNAPAMPDQPDVTDETAHQYTEIKEKKKSKRSKSQSTSHHIPHKKHASESIDAITTDQYSISTDDPTKPTKVTLIKNNHQTTSNGFLSIEANKSKPKAHSNGHSDDDSETDVAAVATKPTKTVSDFKSLRSNDIKYKSELIALPTKDEENVDGPRKSATSSLRSMSMIGRRMSTTQRAVTLRNESKSASTTSNHAWSTRSTIANQQRDQETDEQNVVEVAPKSADDANETTHTVTPSVISSSMSAMKKQPSIVVSIPPMKRRNSISELQVECLSLSKLKTANKKNRSAALSKKSMSVDEKVQTNAGGNAKPDIPKLKIELATLTRVVVPKEPKLDNLHETTERMSSGNLTEYAKNIGLNPIETTHTKTMVSNVTESLDSPTADGHESIGLKPIETELNKTVDANDNESLDSPTADGHENIGLKPIETQLNTTVDANDNESLDSPTVDGHEKHKKRKKSSKHSKESGKRRKLHAEISSQEDESLKLKLKITANKPSKSERKASFSTTSSDDSSKSPTHPSSKDSPTPIEPTVAETERPAALTTSDTFKSIVNYSKFMSAIEDPDVMITNVSYPTIPPRRPLPPRRQSIAYSRAPPVLTPQRAWSPIVPQKKTNRQLFGASNGPTFAAPRPIINPPPTNMRITRRRSISIESPNKGRYPDKPPHLKPHIPNLIRTTALKNLPRMPRFENLPKVFGPKMVSTAAAEAVRRKTEVSQTPVSTLLSASSQTATKYQPVETKPSSIWPCVEIVKIPSNQPVANHRPSTITSTTTPTKTVLPSPPTIPLEKIKCPNGTANINGNGNSSMETAQCNQVSAWDLSPTKTNDAVNPSDRSPNAVTDITSTIITEPESRYEYLSENAVSVPESVVNSGNTLLYTALASSQATQQPITWISSKPPISSTAPKILANDAITRKLNELLLSEKRLQQLKVISKSTLEKMRTCATAPTIRAATTATATTATATTATATTATATTATNATTTTVVSPKFSTINAKPRPSARVAEIQPKQTVRQQNASLRSIPNPSALAFRQQHGANPFSSTITQSPPPSVVTVTTQPLITAFSPLSTMSSLTPSIRESICSTPAKTGNADHPLPSPDHPRPSPTPPTANMTNAQQTAANTTADTSTSTTATSMATSSDDAVNNQKASTASHQAVNNVSSSAQLVQPSTDKSGSTTDSSTSSPTLLLLPVYVRVPPQQNQQEPSNIVPATNQVASPVTSSPATGTTFESTPQHNNNNNNNKNNNNNNNTIYTATEKLSSDMYQYPASIVITSKPIVDANNAKLIAAKPNLLIEQLMRTSAMTTTTTQTHSTVTSDTASSNGGSTACAGVA